MFETSGEGFSFPLLLVRFEHFHYYIMEVRNHIYY